MENKNVYSKHLKQGTLVQFTLPNEEIVRQGHIQGVANTGVPIVGITYIIKPTEELDKAVYPYECFVLPEIQFNILGNPN